VAEEYKPNRSTLESARRTERDILRKGGGPLEFLHRLPRREPITQSHRTHRCTAPRVSNGDGPLAAAAARHRLPPRRRRCRGLGEARRSRGLRGRRGTGASAASPARARGQRSGRAGPRLVRGRYAASSRHRFLCIGRLWEPMRFELLFTRRWRVIPVRALVCLLYVTQPWMNCRSMFFFSCCVVR
jgi:hypothetical protein